MKLKEKQVYSYVTKYLFQDKHNGKKYTYEVRVFKGETHDPYKKAREWFKRETDEDNKRKCD